MTNYVCILLNTVTVFIKHSFFHSFVTFHYVNYNPFQKDYFQFDNNTSGLFHSKLRKTYFILHYRTIGCLPVIQLFLNPFFPGRRGEAEVIICFV